MEYATLENGSPFELITSDLGIHEANDFSFADSEEKLTQSEEEMAEAPHRSQQGSSSTIHTSIEAVLTAIPENRHGYFNCLVIGIGNHGCQNIDYIRQKTNQCSVVKINADLKEEGDCCKHILIDLERLEERVEEGLEAHLHSQLQPEIEAADIVILVSSLTDEIGEVTPIICKQLNESKKSNLVVLFKPTAHIQSKVDQANIILEKVKKTSQVNGGIKNALVVLSQEKADKRYDTVNSRWSGLFETVYDITQCLDTFLNPKNSSKISLSLLRTMLNCGGPTFYGRTTITFNEEGEEERLSVLDNLPEDLSEKSYVDDADLLSARHIIAIVKSSGEFSTTMDGQFNTQIAKIANANYDQSSGNEQQVVHLSHLYDESISEGEMEVIFLATGIKVEAEKHVLETPETLVSSQSKEDRVPVEVVAEKVESKVETMCDFLSKPPAPKVEKKDVLIPQHAKILPLGKPPSPIDSEESIAILQNQHS